MPLSSDRLDRDKSAYIENPTDSGTDRRVQDIEGNKKLDAILSALGGGLNVINEYNEVSSIAQNVLTTIVTYTVPAGETFNLYLIEYSGDNIAKYKVEIDGSTEATKRTNFGSNLSGEFEFNGLTLSEGTVITLRVEHPRPMAGDFEGRIVGTII